MDIDPVAIRKIIAGTIAILLATGVIKWQAVQKNKILRIIILVIGVFLVLSSLLYQFDIIPESSTDSLFKGK